MRSAIHRVNQKFRQMRAGSVLILVVALLVLMALIGTAFLSSSRVDRYATVQNTNNTEIDLLVDGVKNMAKAVIVGGLYDQSQPQTFQPANSTIFHSWTAPELYHQFTDDLSIGSMANDVWLSPRVPLAVQEIGTSSFNMIPVWPCIGFPLSGNKFDSPFVQNAATPGTNLSNVSLSYTNRLSADYVPQDSGVTSGYTQTKNLINSYQTYPPSTANPAPTTLLPTGTQISPTFTYVNYPDGSTVTYPAFAVNYYPAPPFLNPNAPAVKYLYLAGDADGDGVADCGMFKLSVGQLNGLTYYAGVRIVDDSAAVNVNTAMTRRFDFDVSGGALAATRTFNTAATPYTYNVPFDLGSFISNVGLGEMLHTYLAAGTTTNTIGAEFGTLLTSRLNGYTIPSGVAMSTAALGPSSSYAYTYAGSGNIINDNLTARTDAVYTGLGDFFASQLGRRPDRPGYLGANAALSSGTYTVAASPADAAALAYHFVFRNPNASPTPIEMALRNSVYDNAPNGNGGAVGTTEFAGRYDYGVANPAGIGSLDTAYRCTLNTGGSLNAATLSVSQWYADNFNVDGYKMSGMISAPPADSVSTLSTNGLNTDMPRRSLLTGLSTTSNLIAQPQATVQLLAGMPALLPYSCKASVNTADMYELWRGFYLAMVEDGGVSPMGPESTTNGHGLQAYQNLYTGSQWNISQPSFPYDVNAGTMNVQNFTQFEAEDPTTPQSNYYQNPQRMFRSSLRIPADSSGANVFMNGTNAIYLPSSEMVKLRSAIAAMNTMAMRDAAAGTFGSATSLRTVDVPISVGGGAAPPMIAHVSGVTQQPYITEIYANTSTAAITSGPSSGAQNNKPYVAVELYNPYVNDIDLTGWALVALDRQPWPAAAPAAGTTGTGNAADRNPQVIYTFASGQKVPGHSNISTAGLPSRQGGYMVIDDLDGTDVTYRPPSSQLPATGTLSAPTGALPMNYLPIVAQSGAYQKLYTVVGGADTAAPSNTLGQELVLMRPVQAGGTVTQATILAGTSAPVDSFDFTGLTVGSQANGADTWHYVRPNQVDTTVNPPTTPNGLWRFIYPGRYDASDPTPYATTAATPYAPPTAPTIVPPNRANYARSRRQQGVAAAHYNPYPGATNVQPGGDQDPFDPASTFFIVPGVNVSLGYTAGTMTATGNDNDAGGTYPVTFPFVYLNTNQPGPNPTRTSAANASPAPASVAVNAAPFGAFARNSDLLQVPFVGSYTITYAGAGGNVLLEANAITMDCSMAEDTDVQDDPPFTPANSNDMQYGGRFIPSEAVGHFAPIRMTNSNIPAIGNDNVSDTDPTIGYTKPADPYFPYENQSAAGVTNYWRYRWASRIFDYLTVQNPNDDYLPNANPATYSQAAPIGVVNSFISSIAGTSANHVEDAVPVYGKININTAPWRVLAALRFCPFDDADTVLSANGYPRNAQFVWDTVTDSTHPNFRLRTAADGGIPVSPDNVNLAKAIADWRDRAGNIVPGQSYSTPTGYQFATVKGPFRSLTDLLAVPAVQKYLDAINFLLNGPEPDLNFGHLSPGGLDSAGNPVTDGARNDVEERYDLLHRISNQASVRSDTFTVYIVVQGWRNAGSTTASAPPQLVTQRRAAFIVDRSSVNPTNTDPRVYNVPQD